MPVIKQILAREILNSKGNPTVEATVFLDNGMKATASTPSGTSVSSYEAIEVRDNDSNRYDGLGVLKAVDNINSKISRKLEGVNPQLISQVDKILLDLDGTSDKSNLGANAILPVSIACTKAGALISNLPLYAFIRHFTGIQNTPFKMPTPAFNILNGGKHAGNNLDFQEFLLIPASSMPYEDTLNMAHSIYDSLRKTLKDKGATTLVGDEGGFGPSLSTNRDGLILLSEAITASSYKINYDVFLGLDVSANNFYHEKFYSIRDKGTNLTSDELVGVFEGLIAEYNLYYVEDPFSEDDWEGWQKLNSITSSNTIIVGDDLIATNFEKLQNAISKKAIGGVIIKPNQIGTVLETLAVVEAARHAGLKIIVSHRSGETNDDFIADFAVGVGADYAKFGAPVRGERVSKYNRLLEISSEIKTP